MTATSAKSAAPPWAVTAWFDETGIYVELPSANGPMVLNYPPDERGLRQALTLLKIQKKTIAPAVTYEPPSASRSNVNGYKVNKEFTDSQRAEAAKVLKKLGIT